MNKCIYKTILWFATFIILCGCAQEYNSWFAVGVQADTEDPVIHLTSPQNADCVPGRFEIKGYITDDRGVDHIDISYTDLSGDAVTQTMQTTRDFSFTFDLYSANVESGDLAFLMTAYDKAEHSSRTDLSVTLDKSAPVITLFEPNDGGTGVVAVPLIGAISFNGMISDDYSLNFASPNNTMKIYEASDDQKPIMTRLLTETPFIMKNVMNTMDPSHDVGDYIAVFTFEDVNGNIGTKRVRFTTAKGDKSTTIIVDSPTPDYIATDSITLSGAATNQFLDIVRVQYVISTRNSQEPIVPEATKVLELGQAGSFSAIISLKALGIDAGQYNLRVTAVDREGGFAEKILPFEFNKDLVNYDFIDSSDSSWIPGRTPNVSSYINDDFYVEIAATSGQLTDVDYSIIRNGVTYRDWTSILANKDETTDASGNTYYVFSHKVVLSDLLFDIPDGSFNIQTRVRQSHESQWRPLTRVVNIDRTPPSVEISTPTVTTNVNGALVVSGSSSDNMGLKSVQVREDNLAGDTTFHDTDGSLALWSYTVAEDEVESDIPIEEKYGVGPGETKNVSFTVKAADLAGNVTNKVVSVEINYDADTPVLTFLMPETDNLKYSGTLTMNATIADDDYPRKGMNAAMNVYEYQAGKEHAVDYQNATPVETKIFTESMINSNSNLSHALNLDQAKYKDLTKYVIVITGHGWKNRDADPVMRSFFIDKGVPSVDVTTDKLYVTNQIHFTGSVRYKVGSELDSENPCILQYTNTSGNNVTAKIQLASPIEEVVDSVHYYKQAFDVTLNANGTHTGFVAGSVPTVSWGDDSWGNSSKLWTFRATSNTSLQGWSTARVYLDNHKPVVTITSPTNGFLFDKVGTQSFDLKFTVNDEPLAGSSYKLNFCDNVQVSYMFSGGSEWIVESDYGEGSNTALQGVNTYNINFTSIPDALNHKVRLIAKDYAGNVSDETILTFHKTTTPPAITDFAIENARADGLYRGNVTFSITAQDSHDALDDGLAKIELLMDDNVIDTKDLSSSSYPLNYTYTKVFDSHDWADGTHIFSCRVTDKSGIVVYNSGSVGNIGLTVDNAAPTVATSQLLSMGENASDIVAIDTWTAYIGYRFTVEDNVSLLNQNPTIKIGTASDGDDILAATTLQMSMSSIKGYQSEFTNWIDMFDVLNVNYGSTSKIYVTISFSDAAGNETKVIKEYSKGALPTAAFSKAPGYSYSGANDVTIEGTCSTNVGKAWLRVGSGDWKTVTVNNGTWTVTLPKGMFTSSAEWTMTLRVMSADKTAQNVVSSKYLVDIEAPTIAITSIAAYSETAGHVSGDNLSGKVVISGTYNDDLADKMSSVDDAEIRLTIGTVSKAASSITRNWSGTPWTWQLVWDTEDTVNGFLTNMVKTGLTLNVTCRDYAGNTNSAVRSELAVKPYIIKVTGKTESDKIYPVRYYKSGKWGNHTDELRYSLASGTSVTVHGYNLKEGSTAPTVTRGSTSVALTSSDKHSITFSTASGWQSDAINITVNGIAAMNKLYFNIWNFTSLTRSGHDDTLYAIGYDMVLLDDTVTVGEKTSNKVFTTFARNTKIPDYTDYDYCAFSFYEGKTSAATRYTFNGGSSIVDPLFYAAVAKISNDSFESMYTYDEWGVDASRIATLTKDGTTTTNSYKATGPSNRADCVKSARMLYAGSRIYVAGYDDESRQNSPTPEVWFGQAATSNDITMKSVGNCNGYFDIAAAYSTNYPVMIYGNGGKLYSAYVDSKSNSTLTGKNAVITDGDAYCKIVSANSATTMHVVYQDSSNNLSYRRVSGSTYKTASAKVLLECADTEIGGVKEGVTGYNTNIDISKSAKTKGSTTYAIGSPHISYINNSLLNTVTALRYARSKSATSTSAEDWEYMIVPSPVSVNNGATYIRTDKSNNPVIMYKGNDRLYIARLAD